MIHEAPRLRARTGRLKEQRGPPRPNFFLTCGLKSWNAGMILVNMKDMKYPAKSMLKIATHTQQRSKRQCWFLTWSHVSGTRWRIFPQDFGVPTSYIRPDLEHLEFQPPRKMPPPPLQEQALFGFGAIRLWGEDGVGSVGSPTCGSSTFVPGRTMNYLLFIRCWLLTSVSIVDEFTHFFP